MNKIFKQFIFLLIFTSITSFGSLSYTKANISNTELVNLVNSSRAQNNLNQLTVNSKLESAAMQKAQDMFNNQYFAHNSPQGKTPWNFIDASGYEYVYAGENLAIGYDNNNELHKAWMDSPTHRENILNPNFREIGIISLSGTFDGAETVIVVQMFGSTEMAQVVHSNANTINKKISDIIDLNKTTVNPKNIYVGDIVELSAESKTDIKEIYFTINSKKYNLKKVNNNYYFEKVTINDIGNHQVLATVIDSDNNIYYQDLGVLSVSPKIIFGSSDNINSNSSAKTSLIITLFVLIIIYGGYLIYRHYHISKKIRPAV